jgi:hypothetical protein
MKKNFYLTILMVLCLSSFLQAQEIIDENNGYSGVIVSSIGETGSDFYAQSFYASVPAITKFGIYIREISTEGELILSIAVDNGSGFPNVSALLYEGTLKNPSTAGEWFYEEGINVPVTIGQKYWVLIDGYNNAGATGNSSIGLSGSRPDTDENMIYSNSGGVGSWNLFSSPIAIYVAGSPGIYPVTFAVSDTTGGDTAAVEDVNITLEKYVDMLTDGSGLAVYDSVNFDGGDTIEWSATKFGYYPQTGSIVVSDTISISIILEPLPVYAVTFEVSSTTDSPIAGAMVDMGIYGIVSTDASGIAIFDNVYETPAPGISYNITATHYFSNQGSLILTSDTVVGRKMVRFVGTSEIPAESIGVYPNPANDIVNIISMEEIQSIEIITMQGAVVKTETDKGKNTQLKVSELPEGNYLLVIRSNNNACVKHLTIIK